LTLASSGRVCELCGSLARSTCPTPLSSEARHGIGATNRRGSVSAALAREGIGGSLNPTWVEWLMGVPARVDRLAALGNALVPQIAEWIGRRIVSYEATLR
jgi:hypothetical protein